MGIVLAQHWADYTAWAAERTSSPAGAAPTTCYCAKTECGPGRSATPGSAAFPVLDSVSVRIKIRFPCLRRRVHLDCLFENTHCPTAAFRIAIHERDSQVPVCVAIDR